MTEASQSLDELGFVSRGKSRHRPRDAAHLYGGPYPFIQTGDVKHSNLYITNYSQTYSEAGLAQSKMWPAGTLCITIAANIADTAILAFEACFPDSIIGFIPDEHKADARFIKYLFDFSLQSRFKVFTQGVAQDNLSRSKLLSLKFLVPDIDKQKQIADVLSTYDNLIENNRRRIELLEQAARLLYQEWFVNFRFPGHEHVKIINGTPDSWDKTEFSNILSNHIGGGWGQEEPLRKETTPAYVIRGTDIEAVLNGDLEDIALRYHNDSTLKNRLLQTGDIIFEVSGGSANQLIGRSLLITDKLLDLYNGAVICASFCKRLTPISPNLSPYLYYHIKYIRESGDLNTFIKQSASALQNFNFAAFLEHYRVLIPTNTLLDQFSEQIMLMESQIYTLAIQIYGLKRARDLMLPRLMSGEIAV